MGEMATVPVAPEVRNILASWELRRPLRSQHSKAWDASTSTDPQGAPLKLDERKQALGAADLLNHQAVPCFAAPGVCLLSVLTDRGSQYGGKVEQHEDELDWAIEHIDPTRTQAKSPQTHGSCERFQRPRLQAFYRLTGGKQLYCSLEALPADFDEWWLESNCHRCHSGKYCYGKLPMPTGLDSQHLAWETMLDQQLEVKQPSTTRELLSVS